MASKPPNAHLAGCRWSWDGSPCLCPQTSSFSAQRCRLCGLPDNLERSSYGWVHEACLTADDSAPPDYEALGYPETERWYAISELPFNVMAARSTWALMSEMGLVEKDIPAATDIVDSADKDSYK